MQFDRRLRGQHVEKDEGGGGEGGGEGGRGGEGKNRARQKDSCAELMPKQNSIE